MSSVTASTGKDISLGHLSFFCLAALVLGTGFAIAEQRPLVSTLEDFAVDQDQMEVESAGGSLARRVGFSLVALLGVIGVIRAPRAAPQVRTPLAVLALAYFAWCMVSLMWSTDPSSTLRRLAVLGFCFVGALGVSRQMSLRQLCVLALGLNLVFVLGGVLAELALGTFRPWAADYRFAGMAHPNSQGTQCAMLSLAALTLLRPKGRETPWLAAVLIAGVVLLVLTRSRTAVVGFLAGAMALTALRTSVETKVATVVGLGFVASAAFLLAIAARVDVESRVTDAALLGRQEDAESFNGRLPLWTELVTRYVAQRPWCGYGYGTFWNAQHIEEASSLFYWGIREAHSSYVDSLLDTGLIGTGILLLVVLVALRRAALRYLRYGDSGSAFLLALLVFALLAGSMESGFVQPYFFSFVSACGVARLAFYPRQGGTESA